MLANRFPFLALPLVCFTSLGATVDIERTSRIDENEWSRLCLGLILDANQSEFYTRGETLVPSKEGNRPLKERIVAVQNRLSAQIQEAQLSDNHDPLAPLTEPAPSRGWWPRWLWGTPAPRIEYIAPGTAAELLTVTRSLMDALEEQSTKVDLRQARAGGALLDDLVHEWFQTEAQILVGEVLGGFSFREDGQVVPPTIPFYNQIRPRVDSFRSIIAQVEAFLGDPRQQLTDTANPFLPAFMRAAGRTMIDDIRKTMEAESLPRPSLDAVKQLVSLSLAEDVSIEALIQAWATIERKQVDEFQLNLPEAAVVTLVRSFAHRHWDVKPEDVAQALVDVTRARAGFGDLDLGPLETAVLADVLLEFQSEGATATSLFDELRALQTRSYANLRRELPPAALLILLHHKKEMQRDGDGLTKRFERIARLNAQGMPEADRLTDTALALLVTGSESPDPRHSYRRLRELRHPKLWEADYPEHATSEDWVALEIFAEKYSLRSVVAVDLVRQVFTLRGKKMEMSRVITILVLALNKKQEDRRKDAQMPPELTSSDILRFLMVPYLRILNISHALKSEVSPGPSEPESSVVVFWGSTKPGN